MKVKEEIESLLMVDFIEEAVYVEWISNAVSLVKKNGSIRVCTNFQNLNLASLKDEYPMPIANFLIDSSACNEVIMFVYGNIGYIHILLPKKMCQR